jgi:hexokinase
VADRFDRIGFCFSYPAEILPNRDGRLLRWTKEIEIPELVGSCVGAGLVAALEQRGAGRKLVTVLNDTTATLLAGCSVGRAFGAERFVGFILGTGTNCACLHGGQIYNLESGNFAEWPCSAVDDRFDALQVNRGQYRFEKAISGAYLGPLTWVAMQEAVRAGFISASGAAAMERWHALDTVSLSMRLAGEAAPAWGLPPMSTDPNKPLKLPSQTDTAPDSPVRHRTDHPPPNMATPQNCPTPNYKFVPHANKHSSSPCPK